MIKETPADRVQGIIAELELKLPRKVAAYGAAHEVQPQLWRVLMAPYLQPDGTYKFPPHILRQIPRLTRCLDRILRIVNEPTEGDMHGESPWWDLAGDAIAGEATERLYRELRERSPA